MYPSVSPFAGSRNPARASQRGVAIILVLLFVVMLVGLIVAFFSRAVTERQISNSSSNSSKVDIFAQGAVEQIIGDLRTEIIAGSQGTAAGSGTVYTPTAPANAMPMLVGSSGSGGLENLVKVSLSGSNFYPGGGFTSSGTARAVSVSSTTASINGRYISLDRWNKALFLPVGSGTNTTPQTTATFTAPDWVLLARDGSNPTSWSTDLKTSGTGSSVVIGRYAYAIYHEGGLLDANAVGIPYGNVGSSSGYIYLSGTRGSQAQMAKYYAYKDSQALIDLALLNDNTSGTICLSGRNASKLVAWRNWSTLGATGSAAAVALTNASGSNYYTYALSNTTGYLTVSGTLNNGQSDRLFASRQQLIDFVKNTIGCTGATLNANINVLNYLTTFSRDLNQPSFVPDPNRPKILDPSAGGNNANGMDDQINPSFLTVRVQASFTRNDGTAAVVGEPLVKRRFDLKRLAWLTFVGPIANDAGTALNPTANSDVTNIIAALESTYGYTDDFLKLGTAANIKKYFGLSWNSSDKLWKYDVHNGNSGTGSSGAILKLPTNAALSGNAHEPDFFELLKAAIKAGSIGKTATPAPTYVSGVTTNLPLSYDEQADEDINLDHQIIQIGANMIDQFDLDGYPVRITFNDGSTGDKEFRGIENLPYISRIANCLIKVVPASTTATSGTIGSTGLGAIMQCPELWNPHSTLLVSSSVGLNRTFGITGPTQFRIYATSSTFSMEGKDPSEHHLISMDDAAVQASPGFETAYHFSFRTPEQRAFTISNTAITFTVPRTTGTTAEANVFREPTILFQTSGNSTGATNYSAASAALTSWSSGDLGTIALTSTLNIHGGIVAGVDSGRNPAPPIAGDSYLGFYMGSVPLAWYSTTGTSAVYLNTVDLVGDADFHYYLQYWNGSTWVTYDEKYQSLKQGTFLRGGHPSDTGVGWWEFIYPAQQWDTAAAVIDPRTSRFGLLKTWIASAERYFAYPPFYIGDPSNPSATGGALKMGWLDVAQGVTVSLRSGMYSGVAVPSPTSSSMSSFFPASLGWYPGSWKYNNAGDHNGLRPGNFSQNNPLSISIDYPIGSDSNTYTTLNTYMGGGQLTAAQYYTDPDGVVRRAMGGLVETSASMPATTEVGLPMAWVAGGTAATQTGQNQSDSRPVILNRPFRSVADLGYVFSGTPWKNLNFSMPESGDTALLDVFCINDNSNEDSLAAGKVNLNTRQAPVLQAILTGAYRDEWNAEPAAVSGTNQAIVAAMSGSAAKLLVQRTSNLTDTAKGPLRNVGELVGKWVSGKTPDGSDSASSAPYGPASFDGFSADLWSGTSGLYTSLQDQNIQRLHSSAIRALSNVGQTRVWNLMIDVIAQTGRYPQSAGGGSPLNQFLVEGEQRYWVHVAIDRLTGEVIDKQIEVVKE